MSKAVAITRSEKYRTQVRAGTHRFIADEPVNLGGKDLGPTPMELLGAALAACSTITMKLYADRKGWEMEEAYVEVDFDRDAKANITNFIKKVTIKGNLDEAQKQRIFEIASRCPVHRMLESQIELNSELITE